MFTALTLGFFLISANAAVSIPCYELGISGFRENEEIRFPTEVLCIEKKSTNGLHDITIETIKDGETSLRVLFSDFMPLNSNEFSASKSDDSIFSGLKIKLNEKKLAIGTNEFWYRQYPSSLSVVQVVIKFQDALKLDDAKLALSEFNIRSLQLLSQRSNIWTASIKTLLSTQELLSKLKVNARIALVELNESYTAD